MYRTCRRLILLLAKCLLLAACTSNPSVTESSSTSWTQHRTRLSALNDWQTAGKIALRTNQQAESARLTWTQQGDRAELVLSGPLGLSAIQAVAEGDRLLIRQGDTEQRIDISSSATIMAATGWPLPVRQLPYWLRGIPAPGLSQLERVQSGLLRQLDQDGWRIDFQQYGDFQGWQLPTRIELANGELSAKLVLAGWEIESAL